MEDDLTFAPKSSITNCTRTHCTQACLGKLGKNEYVRQPNTIIVANNKSVYITVKSLRSGLMSILLRRVRVSVPFRSTLANHHAAAEIEVSAGK